MAFYVTILIVLLFFAYCESFAFRDKNKPILFAFISCCLFIFSVIRWETGSDWLTYYYFFFDKNITTENSPFEFGFTYLNFILRDNAHNYSYLLFVLGGILFWFQTKALLKLSILPLLSLAFMWACEFAGVLFVRQSVACALLLYSIIYIRQRNLYKFCILVGLATLIHRTSIIFLLAWWIYTLHLSNTKIFVIVITSCALTSISLMLLSSLGPIFGSIVEAKINFYIDAGDDNFGAQISATQIIVKGFASKIFLLLIFLTLIDKKKFIHAEGYINLYVFGIALYFATVGISTAFGRISNPFNNLQYLLMPLVLASLHRRFNRNLFYAAFSIYCLLRLYMNVYSNYPELYLPYKTIFA